MAAARRGQESPNLELPSTTESDVPPIAALFLIYFDLKAGYTLGWKRASPGIELEGVVEYKSLPSGLHTVKDDLIYFVHDKYAGLSAFVNAPASEESRNARMIAVGILVPLSYGRLGRSWKHAEKLKEIASQLIVDTSNTEVLEEYWKEHQGQGPTDLADSDLLLDTPSSIEYKPAKPLSNPRGHARNRSESDGTALLASAHALTAHHPARSLARLMEVFGPLLFPIHRAALLRKRILITSHCPVQETCNFVYDISILSNIPLAVTDILSADAPPSRLRPLFTIGVHDIPYLEADFVASKESNTYPDSVTTQNKDLGHGWIACTTDSILTMKTKLYDILITLPAAHSEDASQKVWPKVGTSDGAELKATQRDLRRYKTLIWGLSRASSAATPKSTHPHARATSSNSHQNDNLIHEIPDTDSIIEPLSWSALAYSGFMWWASAGEQRLNSAEEIEADSQLLAGLALSTLSPRVPRSQPQSSSSVANGTAKVVGSDVAQEGTTDQEMALIAYFHGLTTHILSTTSEIIDAAESDDEREADTSPLVSSSDGQGEEQLPEMFVSSQDMVGMGLDEWSVGDHEFVVDVCKTYFRRRATVEGRNVDICGVRIC